MRDFLGHGSVLVKHPSFFQTLTEGDDFVGWQRSKQLRDNMRRRLSFVPGLMQALTGYEGAELQDRGACHYHPALAVVGGELTGYRLHNEGRYPVIRFGPVDDVARFIGEMWLDVTGLQGSRREDRERYGWHASGIDGVAGLAWYVSKMASEIGKLDQKDGAYGRTWFRWDRGKHLANFCGFSEKALNPETWIRRKAVLSWVGQFLGIRHVVTGPGRFTAFLRSDEVGSAAAYMDGGETSDLMEWARGLVASKGRAVQKHGETGAAFVVWDDKVKAVIKEVVRFGAEDTLNELLMLIDVESAFDLRCRSEEWAVTWDKVS